MSDTVSFEEILDRDGTLVYTNKGISMLPLLHQDRDLMVIKKKGEEPLKKYDVVLFKRSGEGRDAYVLHRILKVNGDGTYWIVGDNCVSGETVKEENILGVLTTVVRKGKTITMTNKFYRFYSKTWCNWYPLRFTILRFIGKLSKLKHKIFDRNKDKKDD